MGRTEWGWWSAEASCRELVYLVGVGGVQEWLLAMEGKLNLSMRGNALLNGNRELKAVNVMGMQAGDAAEGYRACAMSHGCEMH